jgi:hypothetical protein
MSSWDWNRVVTQPELWSLLYSTLDFVDGVEVDPVFQADPTSARFEYLMRELFLVGALETIEPANDPESLALADRYGGSVPRDHLLRQLALQKLPRRCVELRFPESWAWRIEFGPQGSIAHSLMHPSFEEGLLVGADDPHASLPILRVREVHSMARAVLAADVDLRCVPLLLHPVTGVGDDERTFARECLRADWEASKLLDAPALDRLVARLDGRPETRWCWDDRFGWINNRASSYRNPEGAEGWQAEKEFARLRSFFEVIGANAST